MSDDFGGQVLITDNRGRNIDQNDLNIAYSYTPSIHKLGIEFNIYLYINATKTYIDSLFSNSLDAKKEIRLATKFM